MFLMTELWQNHSLASPSFYNAGLASESSQGTRRIQDPSGDEAAPSAGFPMQLNETAGTVVAAAGVPLRTLLDYLSNARCDQIPFLSPLNQVLADVNNTWLAPCLRSAAAPNGWTVAAFPWFIDQTVGGAVATGTHGSSMRFGSLSSQVLQIS